MKNKKILLLTITLVISVSQINAMQHIGRILTKEVAKKAFSKTMTALHYGISFVPMFNIGIFGGYINNAFGNSPIEIENVNETVKSFVQKTLLNDNIQIKKYKQKQPNSLCQTFTQMVPIACNTKYIILDPSLSTFISPSLDSLLKKHKELTGPNKQLSASEKRILIKVQQDLNMYKWVINHEYNHIREWDHYRWFAATFFIPFGTHATHIIGRKILPHIVKPLTKIKIFNKLRSDNGILWFLRKLSKIPTGFVKLEVNMRSFFGYKRHREQEADNNITDDIGILNGGIQYLKKVKDKEAQVPIRIHPPLKNRIAKLEERIKRLDS